MSDDQQAAREAAMGDVEREAMVEAAHACSPNEHDTPEGRHHAQTERNAFYKGWDARGVWERGRGVREPTCECGHSEDAHIAMCVHRSEDGSVCGCEREAVAGRGVREDAGAMREALEYLADPESWGGNPLSQEATLYGHDTPYELAVAALAAATPDERKD